MLSLTVTRRMFCSQDQRRKVLNNLSCKSLRERYVGLLRPIGLRRCNWESGGGKKRTLFFQRPMAGSTWCCIWHIERCPITAWGIEYGYLEVLKEGSNKGQGSMPQAKNEASCWADGKWRLQNHLGTSSEPTFLPLNHITAKARLVHHFQKLRNPERTTMNLRLPLWSCG